MASDLRIQVRGTPSKNGGVKGGYLDANIMDSLYAELRRCRDHCKNAKGQVDHRTTRKHECDERCRPHTCKPFAASTIRQIAPWEAEFRASWPSALAEFSAALGI